MVSQTATGQVSVWFCRTDAVALGESALDALLTRGELERAARFAFPHLSRRFRIGRAALRRILAGYLGVEPREIDFSTRPRGKPYLTGGPGFNLSSSGSLLLIGVCESAEIGVDIELVRDLDDMPALTLRHFSGREREQMSALPEALRQRAFFRGWARKEAVAKAVGDGLHLEFPSFSVPLDATEACAPIAASATFPHGSGWFVRPIGLAVEAESAIAANAPIGIGPLYRIGPDLGWAEERRER